jgi:hypothetical protein
LGLGGMLVNAANGIAALTARLAGAGIGKIGAVGASGFAGYEFGKFLNSLGPDGDLGGWIGSKVYDATHRAYTPNQSSHRPIQVHSTINLDGKKVADAVSTHQAKAASAPQTGISLFDTTQSLVPAGGMGF